ncbi:hypothetical protein Nepgr_017176 [Nepenthes gracilis]|uniref:Uncharacterized protein n=1 Tax=Nepenthes gracilis TaxID=150966 RepID=A0AAD3SNZ8_NEPGR|nr:hypothetical protein Nepgr_017176 [Nepenthes gracilis]
MFITEAHLQHDIMSSSNPIVRNEEEDFTIFGIIFCINLDYKNAICKSFECKEFTSSSTLTKTEIWKSHCWSSMEALQRVEGEEYAGGEECGDDSDGCQGKKRVNRGHKSRTHSALRLMKLTSHPQFRNKDPPQ